MRIRPHKMKFVTGLFGFCIFLTASAYPNTDLIKPKVYVTAYPLKYFVERIAGGRVRVVFPVPDGLDPVFWMPDPEGIADMQKADLIILNGATYEKWLPFVSLPPSKLVDTSLGFKDLYIQDPDSMTHRHGPQGEHSHTGIRHTTWLDFHLAADQAKVVEKTLSRLLPDLRRELRDRYRELERDLMELDQEFGRVFAKISNQRFLTSHPEYGYLARRYSLNLESLLWSPEVMPTPNQWEKVRDLLDEYPAQWMIWEKEPIEESVNKLNMMGIRSLVFNPCGSAPENSDFMTTMYQNLDRFRTAFGYRPEGRDVYAVRQSFD